jgi:hypothetical protein
MMTASPPDPPQAGVIGRTLRLMLAMLLGWMTYTALRFEDRTFNSRALAAFAVVMTFYAIAHFVISRYGPGLHRWFGAVAAVVPLILLFALGGTIGQLVSSAYIGLSLLLQTIRGDGGCEVMTIPAVMVGRRTHLMCILFAPVDWVEKHLTGPGGLPG